MISQKLYSLNIQSSILLSAVLCAAGSGKGAIIVHEITTDFEGGWTSGDGLAGFAGENAIRPDTNHSLTGFAYENDLGERVYIPTLGGEATVGTDTTFGVSGFQAFPVVRAISDQVVYGSNEDGSTGEGSVNRGPIYSTTVLAPDEYDVSPYLTDGINGLGIGSGANNVTGVFLFDVSNLLVSSIGDGVPDIIMGQIASWASTGITFTLRDAAGSVVGNPYVLMPEDAGRVGRWNASRWRFRDRNPADGIGQGTDMGVVNEGVDAQTFDEKAIALYAFDLSEFGLTALQASQAATLEVDFIAEADPAFFAYNKDSITVTPSVPEPGNTLLLSLAGITACLVRRR